MKSMNRDGRLLCEVQGKLFEQSVDSLSVSSAIFVRRFMHSSVAREFDSGFYLEENKTINDVFIDLDNEYGESSYGSRKYHKEVMYWSGYLYRYLCYVYELSSKQAYRLLPFKYVASSYEPYHTLDVSQAIERLLESKNIFFDEERYLRRQLEIVKKVRARNL